MASCGSVELVAGKLVATQDRCQHIVMQAQEGFGNFPMPPRNLRLGVTEHGPKGSVDFPEVMKGSQQDQRLPKRFAEWLWSDQALGDRRHIQHMIHGRLRNAVSFVSAFPRPCFDYLSNLLTSHLNTGSVSFLS